ncbi:MULTISPECIES: hypothetical protein [Aerosakkonema]|uniref:hypothetical protein n=1 Tax=Aerosakkonema TaxID=1246629 RepID=UPI0035B7C0CE
MIVCKFKVKGKNSQYRAIDEAIRTSQFIFAKERNSMGRQSAAERSWSALAQLYDNCKNEDKRKETLSELQEKLPSGGIQTIRVYTFRNS